MLSLEPVIPRSRGACVYRRTTAFHEAGHTVAAIVEGRWVFRAVVYPDDPDSGVMVSTRRRIGNPYDPTAGPASARAAWEWALAACRSDIRIKLGRPRSRRPKGGTSANWPVCPRASERPSWPHGSEHPRRFLDGFAGYLQSDGFAGYSTLARAQPAITGVGCWAHARRKFVDVQKAQAGAQAEGEAARFIRLIRALYQLEQRLAGASASERLVQRQRRAAAILERIRHRLEATVPRVPPKSLLGKAVTYARKQWPQLVRYIEHGETAIDNNTAERAIKPFVIGRKNWLFANTPAGARASANLYGLIETSKANAVEPYGYLADLFAELPQRDLDAGDPVDDLLPWNVDLPDPPAPS